jgi:hypothetical protein|nr:MAG TPA: hypothetical protein [Caudoviricetes sp.]
MKLIDLLVQELPKRGGWPEDAEYCHLTQYDRHCLTIVFSHRQVGAGNNSITSKEEMVFSGIGGLGDTLYGCIVTAKEYESALAASQNPAWDGEGVPPVWCECECHVDEGVIHCIVVGYDFDGKAVVMRNVPACKYFSIQANSGRIKPLRTEAERKRDAAIEAMQREADEGDNWIYSEYEIIYDAIAAGKIPGVKLDD